MLVDQFTSCLLRRADIAVIVMLLFVLLVFFLYFDGVYVVQFVTECAQLKAQILGLLLVLLYYVIADLFLNIFGHNLFFEMFLVRQGAMSVGGLALTEVVLAVPGVGRIFSLFTR